MLDVHQPCHLAAKQYTRIIFIFLFFFTFILFVNPNTFFWINTFFFYSIQLQRLATNHHYPRIIILGILSDSS